jgi:hypothetical protein
MKRARACSLLADKSLTRTNAASIFKLPNVLFQEILSFLHDEKYSDNYLFAILRRVCKSWPESSNLHLCFDSPLTSYWHKIVCEGKRVIRCKKITTMTTLETKSGADKMWFQTCCWNALFAVQNLRVLDIHSFTRDFRSLESLVEFSLSITGVHETLHLPPNLRTLNIDIEDADDLQKLKIVCPNSLYELCVQGDGPNLDQLSPILINAELRHLIVGDAGVPRMEGAVNFTELSFRFQPPNFLNEKNLPAMPCLTTLSFSAFPSGNGKRQINVGLILNRLEKCHHVRNLVLDLDETLIRTKSLVTWDIEKWPNLANIDFHNFTPSDDEFHLMVLKSTVMEINVQDRWKWSRQKLNMLKSVVSVIFP